VKSSEAVEYRAALARGFLAEAEQDLSLERWRSCVDNSQLAVENAGKVVLALFNVPPKTHDPALPIAALLREAELPPKIGEIMQRMLPDLLALGAREHFLTDYGDEATYTLPWDLFTRESAEAALAAARRSTQMSQELTEAVLKWRGDSG